MEMAAETLLRPFCRVSVFCCRVFVAEQAVVQAAQALLIQTDEPVETIAERAGFESPKYFSRIFRAKMGISPKSYRAQMRKI